MFCEVKSLIEYSVMGIFINKAFNERMKQLHVLIPALYALALSFFIALIDENVQFFMPGEVFEAHDILFNTMAVFFAIGTSLLIQWIRFLIAMKKRKMNEDPYS